MDISEVFDPTGLISQMKFAKLTYKHTPSKSGVIYTRRGVQTHALYVPLYQLPDR